MKRLFPIIVYRIGLLLSVAGMVCAGAALIWVTKLNKTLPLPTTVRDQQRFKSMNDTRITSEQMLQTYGWQNYEKGCIHIPIERAMELTVAEWQDPAAARSNLLLRASIVLEVPPPPEATTNQYE